MKTYEQNSQNKLIATALIVLIIAGLVVLADALKSKGSDSASSANQSSSQTTTTDTVNTTSTSSASDSSYKDGSYTASSSYNVPAGNESIKVTLTLSNGIITAASIQNSETDDESASYQEGFASLYKNHVVGKKISGLSISTLAGASDTTDGFNNAVSQITSQAQA